MVDVEDDEQLEDMDLSEDIFGLQTRN
jgi:hypothetical protein